MCNKRELLVLYVNLFRSFSSSATCRTYTRPDSSYTFGITRKSWATWNFAMTYLHLTMSLSLGLTLNRPRQLAVRFSQSLASKDGFLPKISFFQMMVESM
jgi:hypothetical protein